MPPENLPAGAKKIFVAAEKNARNTTCKDREDKDECVNKVAWSAVKQKYKKNENGEWVRKAEIAKFSMAITHTTYDKSTNTRRWKAVASDTDIDLYKDNMTLELYDDFLQRIESEEPPPESFGSDFWNGGTPYLSVAHYSDLNGKGVPGPVDVVYIDGRTDSGKGILKATGRFDDTPIGKESFKAISRDISDNIPQDERVRISIAFLDWKHKHKSNGYIFDRAESDEPICPECLKELITGEYEGKEFLRGHLVHLALTRVPVNTRTSMEVERSDMTTREEDAASIITDELAEELEEESKLEGKSLAKDGDPQVVVKAEDEPKAEEKREKPSDYVDEDDDEEEDDKKKKKKEMKEKKADVVEDETSTSVLNQLLEEVRSLTTEPEPHPLDIAFSELRAVYDEAVQMENTDEALMLVNESYESLVAVIQNGLAKQEPTGVDEGGSREIEELKSFVVEQFGLLNSKLASITNQPQQVLPDQPPPPAVPERRSVSVSTPNLFVNPQQEEKSTTPKLRAMIRRNAGLQ